MSTLFTPAANGVLHAADVAQLLPRRAVKPSNVAIASNTTLQNDSALLLSVDASAEYEITGKIIYTQGVTGQLKMGWSAPTGAVMDWTAVGLASSVTAAASGSIDVTTWTITASPVVGGTNAVTVAAHIFGHLTTSTTAGTLQFKWAQSVSSATGVTVFAGSYLIARQIA